MRLRPRSLLTVLGVVAAGLVPVSGAAAAPPAPAPPAPAHSAPQRLASDPTSPVEARRVDRVRTPRLGWYRCYDYAECATVRLPLDYDDPAGPTTELALLRVRARDQKHRIGSLFVNPGGPGGSGTAIAYAAPEFLGDGVLDRFDVVGFDPRGVGFSDNVRCFRSVKDQTRELAGLDVTFPYTKAEERGYVASSKALGRACSTSGRPLSGSMSTAEAARDMDVLRRAVGDRKLSYLGFSYGTALGQYYANMFPDRVRAITIDGVINPVSWTGTPATAGVTQDDRLRSADGAYKALREILIRCDRAGGRACAFAGGDPVANFDLVVRRLRATPLVIDDPDLGQVTLSYADFIGFVLGNLYSPDGYQPITQLAALALTLTEPPATVSAAQRAAATRAIARRMTSAAGHGRPARDFPYDNSFETYLGVACTDGLHPADAGSWPALTARSDRRAPYFGRAWGWGTAPCASRTWTVRDEDAYTGPFTRRTAAPVLLVGNYWDPATNYHDAVSSSRLLPGSRLLSSDSWGHTAYGTSACVTGAVDSYLLRGTLPAAGTVCVGDVQPFAATRARVTAARTSRPSTVLDELVARGPSGGPKQLPPVVTRPLPTT
jgi:pimeloyl-ACP methyl ester carboxylesterase